MEIFQTPVRLHATGGVESYVSEPIRRARGNGPRGQGDLSSDSPQDEEVDRHVSVKAMRTLSKMANTNITPSLPLALLQDDFDILHTHLPTPWSADWSALISRLEKKSLVLTYHNDIAD